MKKQQLFRILAITVFIIFILLSRLVAAIRYVKPGGAGTAPYTSWATASNDLQAVINASSSGDDIWVAAGTYVPNRRADATGTITSNDRDNAFVLKSGVRIFGGFSGTETATSQRNFATNICILSGDLGALGNTADNCYHVLVCAGTVSGTALNGFYIRYGNANGSGSITVNTISVGRGSGAGMRINSSSPTISNCVFSANNTTNNGGGMVCDNSSPAITNCVFSGNRANDGGALLNTNASATELINCTFAGNIASVTGGAIRNGNSSSPVIINCVIWNNWVGFAADAIYNADAGSVPVVNYCVVQGGYTGTGNINTNPLFVNALAPSFAPTVVGDYRVQRCGPCINTGNNSYVPGSINNDLDYTSRINYGTVDIGAYELQLSLAVPDANGIVYVDSTKNGNGSSWANAVKEMADALAEARHNPLIKQIWVAKGTYFPKYPINFETELCNPATSISTFALTNGLKVYGGFAGGETDTVHRNLSLNKTILSGEIGNPAFLTDNCHHVISSIDIFAAYINSLSLTAGYGSLGSLAINVNSSLLIKNCAFFRGISTSDGGAIANITNGKLNVYDCSFEKNTAADQGGSIYSASASIKIFRSRFQECSSQNGGAIHVTDFSGLSILENCEFLGNETNNFGGAVCSHAQITANNCLFAGNKSNLGGALHLDGSNSALLGCTIVSNTATNQGSVYYNGPAAPSLTNCIIYGNSTLVPLFFGAPPNITYSTIQGGYAGTGNISTDPLFVNPQLASAAPTIAGDYRLQKCSPAINVGSNALVPAGVTKDLDSNSRISLATVDMGAYEKHLAKPDANGIVYVDSSNVAGAGDGSSWAKAATNLADALKEAKTNTDVKEIWVAKGTYKPIYNAADIYLNSICHITDRDASFVLVPDVKLYGGFAGGETSLSHRNITINPVSLSGDIGIANDTIDNTYHVAIGANNLGNCLVDGVIVEYGKCASNIISSKTVNTRSITRRFGGGIYLHTASPVFKNCTIRFNSTGYYGGGLFSEQTSAPVFLNCSIIGNQSTFDGPGGGAGAYISTNSTPSFFNCRVTGNSRDAAGNSGAGLSFWYNTGGSIINCTIAGNYSAIGAGIYTLSPLTIANSIINRYLSFPANISSVSSSCIYPFAHAGTGNISSDPLFVYIPPAVGSHPAPTIVGDYRLQACSPVLNMGENSLIPPGLSKDLDSMPRIMFSSVDMGAYEKQDIDLANTIWKGVNTNWNDKINWCGGYIPSDTTNVTIPLTGNNPLVNAGYSNAVKNISFANSSNIGVAPTGSFTIKGKYVNNGAAISNGGTWIMSGDSTGQQLPGTLGTVTAMHNLTIDNSNGVTLNKPFELTGTLTPMRGNININNALITLNSDALSTARVDSLRTGTSITYSNGGKFSVERFLTAKRAWRFLTAPISAASNLTISNAWQEGVSNSTLVTANNPNPGFGTTLTRSNMYNAANGFDVGVSNIPSVKYFSGGGWNGVPSATNGTTAGANNGLITDQQGYMLFFRGSRQTLVGTSSPVTESTLRPSGQIKTGNQTIVCNGLTVIGNPYASSINFHQIVLDNPGLPDAFYAWDPNLAGAYNVGGWVTYGAYNSISGTYTVAPLLTGSSAASNTGDIPSGAAIMINYTGTITIKEQHKSAGLNNALMRPGRQLDIQLHASSGNSNTSLNDGVAIVFGGRFIQRGRSVLKNANFSENLSVRSNDSNWAIQTRPLPHAEDTIWLHMAQMRPQFYELWFIPGEMEMPANMQMYLEDRFLNRQTIISHADTTRYSFSVTANAGTASTNRFYIVFKRKKQPATGAEVMRITKKETAAEMAIPVPQASIWPNPVTGNVLNLHVKTGKPGQYLIRIFNSDGKWLLSQRLNQQQSNEVHEINVSKLRTGLYQIELSNSEKQLTVIVFEKL